MHTDPKIETRDSVTYMGIRVQTPMSDFSTVILQTHDEIFVWLREHSVAPAGAPFIRYHVINMEGLMDVEMGVPVAGAVLGNGRINANTLPEGQYATLIYTGVANGVPANGVLIDWAMRQGLVWDRWDDPNGDAFGSRVESFLTDPADEPDMTKWETEVAIKLADAE